MRSSHRPTPSQIDARLGPDKMPNTRTTQILSPTRSGEDSRQNGSRTIATNKHDMGKGGDNLGTHDLANDGTRRHPALKHTYQDLIGTENERY